MKMKKLRIVSILCPIGIAMAILSLTGCATKKGPQQVWASPVQRVVSPVNQAITDAPRTQPGKIMDPEALTYAQVPSRILYLPGHHGVKSRKSPRQEVAYDLVPVSRIGAIQAEATPEFGEIIVQGSETKIEDITEMTVISEKGETLRGKGRRLGVLGKAESAKDRARDLLKKGEELQWDAERGWVGFVVEQKAKPYTPKKTETDNVIADVEDTPRKEGPKIESLDDANKKPPTNENESIELDLKEEETKEEEIELSFD